MDRTFIHSLNLTVSVSLNGQKAKTCKNILYYYDIVYESRISNCRLTYAKYGCDLHNINTWNVRSPGGKSRTGPLLKFLGIMVNSALKYAWDFQSTRNPWYCRLGAYVKTWINIDNFLRDNFYMDPIPCSFFCREHYRLSWWHFYPEPSKFQKLFFFKSYIPQRN